MWLNAVLQQTDSLRCSQGRLFDAIGLGPTTTPSRAALSLPGAQLRAYDGTAGGAIVIVPAPIKRAYIWDLAPSVSVVRQCLRHGLRVYLVEWREPAGAEALGLADYADRLLLSCVDAVARESGENRVALAGHSLGGTLAAIFAALHPERVRALVLLETPTKFGADAGPFALPVMMAPAGSLPLAFDTVPGSFLDLVSVTASPLSFVAERWYDFLAAANAGDPDALLTHLRVERWTLGELAMPARLFEEVVEQLYREDRFLSGKLVVGGRQATPAALDMPLLSVMRPDALIVPPCSVLPLHDAAPSRRQLVLRYEGDRGAALRHVGILVGKRAHQRVWPAILRWLDGCR